jgi:RHS repeat-associated protein
MPLIRVRLGKLFLFFSLLMVFPRVSISQATVGIQPFGSYQGNIDQINLQDLSVHIDIPLFVHRGRGTNMGTSVHLLYDTSYISNNVLLNGPDLGWRVVAVSASGGSVAAQYYTENCTEGSGTYQLWSYSFIDSTGYTHLFSGTSTYSSCTQQGINPTTQLNELAADGSGYRLAGQGPDATVTDPSGTIYYYESGSTFQIADANGNIGYVGATKDTSNVTATVSGGGYVTNQNGIVTSRQPMLIQYTDSSGDSQTITISYSLATYSNAYSSSTYGLIQTIAFPGGLEYQCTYQTPSPNALINPYYLSSIELPTGGTITYQLSYPQGISQTGSSAVELVRTTSDGVTTYNSSSNSHLVNSTSSVLKPDGSSEKVSFVAAYFTPGPGVPGPLVLETAHSWLNSSGTVLRSTMKCYNGSPDNCTTTSVTPPLTQTSTTTTLDNGQSSKVIQSLNANGLPTEVDEYDFGASTATRKTITAYATLGNNIVSRPYTVTVEDGSSKEVSQTTYGYDEYSLASSGLTGLAAISGSRGNMTSQHVWNNTLGNTLDSHWQYDNAGQVVKSQDPAGSVSGKWSQYEHDATDTYVTNTVLPTPSSGVSLTTSATYDPNTGLMLTSTDPNGQVTIYKYEALLRLAEVDYPDGGKTTKGYTSNQLSDYNYQNSGTHTDTETLYDGYGRTSRVAVSNGQASKPWYQQDSCYNADGNLQFQSYSYQGTGFNQGIVCSSSGDAYLFDALSRVTKMTHADGTYISYSYTGRATQVTDENGASRISQIDGLGRLTSVCEISSATLQGVAPLSCGQDIAATGFLTSYTYSLANHTTIAVQGAQTRTFQTDSAGRTASVAEPERGSTTYAYTYNSTGLAVSRQRPKANQTSATTTTTTTTQYDALGRLASVSYNDSLTSNKSYYYDINPSSSWTETLTNPKGGLVLALSGAGSTLAETLFSYDSMGRVLTMWQCAPSICGTANQAGRPALSFSYDWTGNLTGEFDGASGLIGYTHSPAGEVTTIAQESYQGTTGNPANMVSNVINGPNGPISYALGNGLEANFTYDSLGRRNGLWLCSGSTSPACTGGTQIYGSNLTTKGSQITQEIDTILNQQITYGYDQFNRLASRNVYSGAAQNFTYSYDRYGNRWAQTLTAGSGPQLSVAFSATTNQITTAGYIYDAAGNMTNDSFHGYTYDAEGNILTVDGGSNGSYVYDALNRRVRVQTSASTYEYLYDYANRRISSWLNPSSGNPGFGNEGRIYWDGRQIAYRAWDGTTYFDQQNYLGTERLRTNYTGAVAATFFSLPWGDDSSATIGGTGSYLDNAIFAGLDADTNTSGAPMSDHAQFRNYSFYQGRWLVPDPYDGSYDLTNPQSLNRYAYVLNNPLSFTDPSGMVLCDWGSSDQGGEDYDDDKDCAADGGTVVQDHQSVTVNASNSAGPDPSSVSSSQVAGPPGAPSNPSNPRQLDPNNQECTALAQKIDNLVAQIQKRQNALDGNPLNLPLTAPGALRNSVQGHQQLLNNYVQYLANAANDYNNKCGGGPPGSPSGSPSTAGSASPSVPPGVLPAVLVGVGVVGTAVICPECLIFAPFVIP